MAEFVHNSWPNTTTMKTPFDLIMGYMPQVQWFQKPGNIPTVEEHLKNLEEVWVQAQEGILKAQNVMDSPYVLQKKEQIDEDPAIQVLQKHAHLVTEEEKAQQEEEQAEDNACIGRLVSADNPVTFRAATGVLP